MRGRRANPVAGNPVLIGAVTVLVVVTAVFLAYNANSGLPFVSVFNVRVETPNASRLVVGNDVREGGRRVGQVSRIDPVRLRGGRIGAELTLALSQDVAPLPADTRILIRPRSTLGLKYVDLIRGRASRMLADNGLIQTSGTVVAPELDDFFAIFDPATRRAVRENLRFGGDAFAGRGADLNRTLAALPQLLGDLEPVARTLSAPSTGLRRSIRELADAARVTAPVSGRLVSGLRGAADTFEALSRDPDALRDTIALSPPTLQTGIDTLPSQRPLLQALASIAPALQGTSRELRVGAPVLARALSAGTDVLPDTPPFNDRLRDTLASLQKLAASPTTNVTLRGLQSTADTLNPTLRYVGPHITVCNYWTSFWSFLSDHLSERVPSGTVQRVLVKTTPPQLHSPSVFGATSPADGHPADPVTTALLGDAAALHSQPYGRAVDEQGNADCENGQRGYPRRLATGAPEGLDIVVDPRTPGNQGPTFTGRPRVPRGQTFSAEPTGLAPPVVIP